MECEFVLGDSVVYPTHGLGEVVSVGTAIFGKLKSRVIGIRFTRERMTLKIPVDRLHELGLRHVLSSEQMNVAINVLCGYIPSRRTMWSRRAQEYELKINSGNPKSIAEVVRELHRTENQGSPSFSERQIYQQALSRLAYEYAVVEKIDYTVAETRLEKMMTETN